MKTVIAFAQCSLALCAIVFVSGTGWAQYSSTAYSSPSKNYSSAKNLSAYINQLKLNPNSKGELYVAEAKAIEECGAFKVRPAYAENMIHYLRNTNSEYSQVRIRMYERLKNRCQGLSLTTALGEKDIPTLYKEAADKGNIEAIAHNLVENSVTMPSSEVLTRAIGIISTKNPSAIFVLSNLFGANGPLTLTNGINLGPSQSVIAWRLVACDLGFDCSPSSSFVQQSCLFGGLCGTGGYRENIQNAGVPPQQYENIVAAENEILLAVRNGSINKFIIAGEQ